MLQIGSILKKLFEEGVVKREDLWITSKLWFYMDSKLIFSHLKAKVMRVGHWSFISFHFPLSAGVQIMLQKMYRRH